MQIYFCYPQTLYLSCSYKSVCQIFQCRRIIKMEIYSGIHFPRLRFLIPNIFRHDSRCWSKERYDHQKPKLWINSKGIHAERKISNKSLPHCDFCDKLIHIVIRLWISFFYSFGIKSQLLLLMASRSRFTGISFASARLLSLRVRYRKVSHSKIWKASGQREHKNLYTPRNSDRRAHTTHPLARWECEMWWFHAYILCRNSLGVNFECRIDPQKCSTSVCGMCAKDSERSSEFSFTIQHKNPFVSSLCCLHISHHGSPASRHPNLI